MIFTLKIIDKMLIFIATGIIIDNTVKEMIIDNS